MMIIKHSVRTLKPLPLLSVWMLILASISSDVVAESFPALNANLNKNQATHLVIHRGGASGLSNQKRKKVSRSQQAYALLAKALLPSLNSYATSISSTSDSSLYTAAQIQKAFTTLSKAQSTLKQIDGASHEFYQRSHSSQTNLDKSQVRGRAARSASRTGCTADALFACELLDFSHRAGAGEVVSKENKEDTDEEKENQEQVDGTLQGNGGREIVLNTTITNEDSGINVHVLVLHEPYYIGGGGMNHGGIDALVTTQYNQETSTSPRGRYLVILRDEYDETLDRILFNLDVEPEFIDLNVGLVSGEVASVNGNLWRCAGAVLESLRPLLTDCDDENDSKPSNTGDTKVADDVTQPENENESIIKISQRSVETSTNPDVLPAIHFVGNSVAGGIASLAAAILDGSIPTPSDNKKRRKKRSKKKRTRSRNGSGGNTRSDKQKSTGNLSISPSHNVTGIGETKEFNIFSLHGIGSGRTSAMALGAPPSLSANIKAGFITSVIHGDDIVCRLCKSNLDRLRKRSIRILKGGLFTKNIGWMTDTFSLTVSQITPGLECEKD